MTPAATDSYRLFIAAEDAIRHFGVTGVQTCALPICVGLDGRRRLVKILHESATAIEPDTRRVRLDRGFLSYERLIVAPGIDSSEERRGGKERRAGRNHARGAQESADRGTPTPRAASG